MQAVALDAPPATGAAPIDAERLRRVVLVRVAAAVRGLTKATLAEDLAPLVAHRFSPAQWRAALDAALDALAASGLIAQSPTKLEATDAGLAAVSAFLGVKGNPPRVWSQVRNVRLVAKALDLERGEPKRLKTLDTPQGLRSAILQQAYNLKIKGVATPSRLRAALTKVALDRAFGSRARESLAGKLGLSAKAGRLLAGQLAQRPRDFGTDARLVAALAAENAGAVQSDLGSLQLALLRRFIEAQPQTSARPAPRAASSPQQRSQPAQPAAHASPAAAISGRPDLMGFAQAVRGLAAKDAQGWAGNRKAFISHVWRRLREERASWGLSEIEFKCMLAEAHRAGHVALANADLKDSRSLKDVQESAVAYKNAVFHFVRVDA